MPNDTVTLYLVAVGMAFIPIIIWFTFLFKKTKRRGIQVLLFFGSIFSVVPIFALHYFLNSFPQFDILNFFKSQFQDQSVNFVMLYVSVGIVEEIIKQTLVRWADRRYLLIHTINDSIHFGLVAALGFSFAENIFYIFNIYTQLGLQQLIIAYLFRSIFTTAAHLVFSGIFGYYYGIAKFAINIVEQESWTGKHKFYPAFVARLFRMSKVQAFRQIMILRGLWIAIVMHAIHNMLCVSNQILPVVLFVTVGFIFLQYKLSQKTGKLILLTNSNNQTSTMNKSDEEVVIELMGMWLNNKRYVDVIHICQRLLERDPDNKIVQLFKAKAMDKMDTKSAYGQILEKMFPETDASSKTIADMVKNKALRSKDLHTIEQRPKITVLATRKPEEDQEDIDHFNLKL